MKTRKYCSSEALVASRRLKWFLLSRDCCELLDLKFRPCVYSARLCWKCAVVRDCAALGQMGRWSDGPITSFAVTSRILLQWHIVIITPEIVYSCAECSVKSCWLVLRIEVRSNWKMLLDRQTDV